MQMTLSHLSLKLPLKFGMQIMRIFLVLDPISHLRHHLHHVSGIYCHLLALEHQRNHQKRPTILLIGTLIFSFHQSVTVIHKLAFHVIRNQSHLSSAHT